MKTHLLFTILPLAGFFTFTSACERRERAPNAPGAWYEDERIRRGQKEGSFDGAQEKLIPGSRH
jgi:hypothetical protein